MIYIYIILYDIIIWLHDYIVYKCYNMMYLLYKYIWYDMIWYIYIIRIGILHLSHLQEWSMLSFPWDQFLGFRLCTVMPDISKDIQTYPDISKNFQKYPKSKNPNTPKTYSDLRIFAGHSDMHNHCVPQVVDYHIK
jgi:hypothetical protein